MTTIVEKALSTIFKFLYFKLKKYLIQTTISLNKIN